MTKNQCHGRFVESFGRLHLAQSLHDALGPSAWWITAQSPDPTPEVEMPLARVLPVPQWNGPISSLKQEESEELGETFRTRTCGSPGRVRNLFNSLCTPKANPSHFVGSYPDKRDVCRPTEVSPDLCQKDFFSARTLRRRLIRG
jgi:hypothetical protein